MLHCFFFLGLYLAVDYGDVLRVGSGANPYLLLETLEPSDFGLRAFDLSLGFDADGSALPVPEGKEKSDRGKSSDGPGLEPGPPSKKNLNLDVKSEMLSTCTIPGIASKSSTNGG